MSLGWSLVKPHIKEAIMAKTKDGKKIVPVKPHTRKPPKGSKAVKPVKVKPHRRSTPN